MTAINVAFIDDAQSYEGTTPGLSCGDGRASSQGVEPLDEDEDNEEQQLTAELLMGFRQRARVVEAASEIPTEAHVHERVHSPGDYEAAR